MLFFFCNLFHLVFTNIFISGFYNAFSFNVSVLIEIKISEPDCIGLY